MEYNHKNIEKKWQKYWSDNDIYLSKENPDKPKYYSLDMFPYPSGAGLHVGHPKGYIATDILARLKMMQGFNVLHPMGFDAFGLPTENYAIKKQINPVEATKKNIQVYKKQLEILGFSYDSSREINTTDPKYYKWTQWIFLQMFKKGLAYQSDEPINWCPSCQTGLADEDLEDGLCERCGSKIEKKSIRQWVLRITDYAQRLLDDLDGLPDWEDSIKDMQRHWIGRSQGAEIDFSIEGQTEKIKTFTTRLDTIFGCTYLVLAPEHPLLKVLSKQINNYSALVQYIAKSQNKSDLDRTDLNREKTGLLIEGLKAIHPFTQKPLEIFVADYVLASYGTGAVMAVPAHDERDFLFAQKYNLPIKYVIKAKGEVESDSLVFTEDGYLVDSGDFSHMSSSQARREMMKYLKSKNIGQEKVNYKLKDWVFSRQRYWGEPIPIIHCADCGVVPVKEEDLPVVLPAVENYQPSGTGQSPLAKIDSWVNTVCPVCQKPAKREINTMPQWAGSCWYYLRYMDPHNQEFLVREDKEKYWSPVDFYVGGAEHANRHLIYARFWHKFLYDIKVVSHLEPFKKFRSVGLIMGEDGRKMSKRWGNVVNPDKMVEKYGADSLRIYTMFMGPFDQVNSWNSRSLNGSRKFLDRIYKLFSLDNLKKPEKIDKNIQASLHKAIKKIEKDIVDFKFNTAISTLMILSHQLTDYIKKDLAWPINLLERKSFIQILSPFAPHLAEELWNNLEEPESIFLSTWPKYSQALIEDDQVEIGIQINGKMRLRIKVGASDSQEQVWQKVKDNPALKKWLADHEIVKKIYIPKRILNIVIK